MKQLVRSGKYALVLGVLSSLVVGIIFVYAANITIDLFDGVSQSITANAGTTNPALSTSDAASLGDQRDFEVVWTTGSDITLASNSGTPPSGLLSFSSASSSGGRGIVTFDGDSDPRTLDPDGLCNPTCEDLTDGSANEYLRVRVAENDLAATIHFRLYNGSTNDINDYIEYALSLPGSIPPGSSVDFLMPFIDFVPNGNGANANNVGAIQIFYNRDTVVQALDVAIEFFDSTNFSHDWADLPSSYSTYSADNGPRHLLSTGLRLGLDRNAEEDGNPTLDATGDNFDDGVTRDETFKWDLTNGGAVYVDIAGCAGSGPTNGCRLNGWIDWNANGTFDSGEQIINNVVVGNGTGMYYWFSVPNGQGFPGHSQLSARFRVCQAIPSDDCDTPAGEASTGEVEDYIWDFGPNAVTLSAIDAGPALAGWPAFALVVAMVAGGAGLFVWKRRA